MGRSCGEVEQALAVYARVTRAAMASFLPEDNGSHYLYGPVRDYPDRGGKALRPALLLATCQAFGGSLRSGLAPAAALELLHNSFLVHDDVEDGSSWRRGLPTLHELHGIGLAVNAGDALASLALQPLHADPMLGPRLARMLVSELLETVRLTTEGQALELGWRRHGVVDLGVSDYLLMAARKTCWYSTVAPLRMGSLCGTRGAARLRDLTRFGLYLGIAFQIRDDLLNVEGAAGSGKDVHSDVREGKRTLMLIHLLRNAEPETRAWLVDVLGTPGTLSVADDQQVRDLMNCYGSLEYVREFAAGVTAAAFGAFDVAFAKVESSAHVEFIRQVIPYVLDRRE
jgi:geranylgeranyl diphosphate synthase type II